VNRSDRGPLLLIVAGVLLILAVVAYSINDAEEIYLRREAALRGHQAAGAQTQGPIAELKSLQEESARTIREKTEILGQHDEILKSLKRIERLVEAASSPERGR
jgi:hypothetical protein